MECEPSSHLTPTAQRRGRGMLTEAKEVAAYLWQCRSRGAVLVLVLAFSPILLPLVVLLSFLGLVSAGPILCAAAALHFVFRDGELRGRGTVHLLLSARWKGRYQQRNDEGTWSLNGAGDVFMAAALQCAVADAKSTELSKLSCREVEGSTAFEEQPAVVEADPHSSPPAESSLDESNPSGEEQLQICRCPDASEATESVPVAQRSSPDSIFSSTSGRSTEDWATGRRWEEESTRGGLAPSPPRQEGRRSMLNPLFEFEPASSPEGKSPISNSPRLRRLHSTSPGLSRTPTRSSSSMLSPRQLSFHECKRGLQVQEAEQEKAGPRVAEGGTRTRVSHPFPWR